MSFFKFQNLIGNEVRFEAEEINFIDLIPKLCDKVWDGNIVCINYADKHKFRDKLVEKIKSRILEYQEPFCIYCGVSFKICGNPDREHIAPKGEHPEFVFNSKNLALACRYCNSSSKKGTKNTIEVKSAKYEDCSFTIIHPYFDQYENEIDFAFENANLLLSAKNNSLKGKATIEMFDLMEPVQTALRGAAILREAKLLSIKEEEIIDRIRNKKYSIKR